MIRRIAALLLVLTAPPAGAQSIPVQTGEHADFTRVVLRIDPLATWTAGRTEDGYGVAVDGAADYDIGDFYRIIPRDRIEEVRVDRTRGSLLFTVGCECHLSAFLDRPDILVIDIKDGLRPDSPFDTALFDGSTDTEGPALDLALIPRPIVALPQAGPRSLDPLDPARLAERQADRDRLAALENSMAESLARATSQGLLTLRTDIADDAPTAPVRPEPVADDPPAETPARPGLIARTSVDSGLDGLFGDGRILAEALSCWPDTLVDLQTWGTEEPFDQQIARARSALTGEFDTVNEAAVLALARLNLYFGFGREAAQTLTLDTARSRDQLAAEALAQVVDDDPLTVTDLRDQALCPGPVALWAVLSRTVEDQHPQTDAQAVALAFRQLPLHLQSHLAPRLAVRLTALGEPDLAESLLTPSLEDLSTKPEATLALSEISRATGEVDRASAALEDLAGNVANAGPAAILALLDLTLAEGTPIAADTIALAEATLFEHRDTSLAPALADAIIRADTASDAFAKALDQLAAAEDLLTDENRLALRNTVFADGTARASDTAFLDLVFSNPLDGLDPAVQNGLADRLLDLGFAERAYDLLRGPAIGEPMGERRYLRARTAMALGRPAEAEAHLAGITTDRANRILQLGPTGQPVAAMTDPGDPPDESLEDWRAGNWAGLARGPDPLLQDVSTRLLGGGNVPPDLDAPLATGRELVSQATATREALDALLNRFETPVPAEP